MMTKEEYEKEFVRMWDTVRTSYKGKQACVGVLCKDCPLNLTACTYESGLDVYKAFDVLENWCNEHPKEEE